MIRDRGKKVHAIDSEKAVWGNPVLSEEEGKVLEDILIDLLISNPTDDAVWTIPHLTQEGKKLADNASTHEIGKYALSALQKGRELLTPAISRIYLS